MHLAISGGWKLRGLNLTFWNSLMVQRMRIHLPMPGTQVWSLVWEDPTGHGATVLMRHNSWSLCTLKSTRHNYWVHVLQLLKPVCLEPVLSKQEKPPQEAWALQGRVVPRSLQLEKAQVQQWRPSAAKNKQKKSLLFTVWLNLKCHSPILRKGPAEPVHDGQTQTLVGDIPLQMIYWGDHLTGAEVMENGFPKTQD